MMMDVDNQFELINESMAVYGPELLLKLLKDEGSLTGMNKLTSALLQLGKSERENLALSVSKMSRKRSMF